MPNSQPFTWGSVSWDGAVTVGAQPATRTSGMQDQPDFHCIRVVVNLQLTRSTPGPLVPPARVSVNISADDLQKAGNISNIKVAYWRGKWNLLSIVSRDSTSVTVSYDKNGDPPLAVGQ